MSDQILWFLTVFGLAVIVHHHLTYPWLLARLAEWRRRRTPSINLDTLADRELPSISLIVPAHNEEAYIERKLHNLAELDYPRDRLEIVVTLDGCTDRTEALAVATAESLPDDLRLQIVGSEKNFGKIAVLNYQIAQAQGTLVGLSDTSAIIPANALRRVAKHFLDADVGVVAPGYELGSPGRDGEQAYMNYLARVRRDEATLHAPLGCHGALYFFRRELWRPLPPDTINDDFVLPLRIFEQGFVGRYDDEIRAVELECTHESQEWRRRIRIGAGNLQQSLWLWRLANPLRPWLSFMFVSGKGARPFMPLVAVMVTIASLQLAARGSNAAAVLLALILLVLAAGLAAIAAGPRSMPRLLGWLAYLIEGHTASLLGAVMFLLGRRIGSWQSNTALRSEITAELRWRSKSVAAQPGRLSDFTSTTNGG